MKKTQEARWVQKEDYIDNPEGMKHFFEVQADSGSFVIHQWGHNGEEEDSVLSSVLS